MQRCDDPALRCKNESLLNFNIMFTFLLQAAGNKGLLTSHQDEQNSPKQTTPPTGHFVSLVDFTPTKKSAETSSFKSENSVSDRR